MILSSCQKSNKKQVKMNEKPTVIELVLFNVNEGVSLEKAKIILNKLNEIVRKQKGFISRKTAIAKEGQFLDLVYWTDLNAAEKASEILLKNEEAAKVFSIIKQDNLLFKHFEIFNNYN